MKELSEATFQSSIDNSRIAVVKFFAPWCHPCKALDNTLNKWGPSSGADVFKVDIDENPGLARDFGVMSVPTIIVFKNGAEHNRAFGAVNETKLNEIIT